MPQQPTGYALVIHLQGGGLFPLSYATREKAMEGYRELHALITKRRGGGPVRYLRNQEQGWCVDLDLVTAFAVSPTFMDPAARIAEQIEQERRDEEWWKHGELPPWQR